METLSIESVSALRGNLRVLWDVSIRVGGGELVAIVGANGAGKSTLLMSIMGLVRISQGSVKLRGREISGHAPHRVVSEGVSFVPEGRRLFPMMTVEENLLVAIPERDGEAGERMAKVCGLFPVLAERRSALAGRLSGGEQQMVAIGRALMAGPDLLVVDEPSLGLSPAAADRVFGALKELTENGTAVLLAEQNMQLALSIADRAYLFESGRVVAEGEGRKLAEDPKARMALMGVAV